MTATLSWTDIAVRLALKGAYPDWSSGLVRMLAAIPGVSRVEWRDID